MVLHYVFYVFLTSTGSLPRYSLFELGVPAIKTGPMAIWRGASRGGHCVRGELQGVSDLVEA